MSGPLEGLRVLEVATGVAGPYAGRLFAMLGATVAKVEPPDGDSARTLRVDHRPLAGLSPVYVHLNTGKRNVAAPSRDDLDALLLWADVVVDNRVRGDAAGTGFDPDLLASLDGGPRVLASVTAWGFEAVAAGVPTDELVVQAASGALSANGDPGRAPVRFPGWQSQYLAGGYAAAATLAALADGAFHHVDVRWVGAMASGTEIGFARELHRPHVDRTDRADRADNADGAGGQAAIQDGAYPAGAFRCQDGYVVPGTVRPVDWTLQCAIYGRPELADDERFTALTRMRNRDELLAEIQPWYDAHTKREIFGAALEAGWAAAMVMTAGDVLEDAHIAERRFLSVVEGVPGAEDKATVAGRPWRASNVGEGQPLRLSERGADPLPSGAGGTSTVRSAPKPVGDLTIVELTWAWAGPFLGRFLGACGADVIRIETGNYPDGWRTRVRWKDVGSPVPDGVDPNAVTWDAAVLHNTINRNKRSVSVDLTDDDGQRVFARLLGAADALVVNMGYSVLHDRGVEDLVHAAIADGLVVVQMPALGTTGPYRAMPGYGTLMEGMGGLAARMGYLDEGARVTTTYYPDAVAGLHGTVALLAGLAGRAATGEGSFVDLSQQETMWLQLGEGIVLRSTEGREPDRIGNAEAGCAPSGIYAARRGWVAVTVANDEHFAALVHATAPRLDGLADLDGLDDLDVDARLARAEELDKALTDWLAPLDAHAAAVELRRIGVPAEAVVSYEEADADGVLAARGLVEEVDHPVTRTRRYVAIPVRVDGRWLRTRRYAPTFAEHTDEVLSEWLAMPADERRALTDRDVVGTRPVYRPKPRT